MDYKSRYDDPEYQEQVAKQMLATPTHLIACRAITDQRQEIRDMQHLLNVAHGQNSPENHFNYFMQELERRFAQGTLTMRDKAQVDLFLKEIDNGRDALAELNAAKLQLLNMFTRRI